jgi:hypothetical protein
VSGRPALFAIVPRLRKTGEALYLNSFDGFIQALSLTARLYRVIPGLNFYALDFVFYIY